MFKWKRAILQLTKHHLIGHSSYNPYSVSHAKDTTHFTFISFFSLFHICCFLFLIIKLFHSSALPSDVEQSVMIARMVVHEVVHQWFGNLVTCHVNSMAILFFICIGLFARTMFQCYLTLARWHMTRWHMTRWHHTITLPHIHMLEPMA